MPYAAIISDYSCAIKSRSQERTRLRFWCWSTRLAVGSHTGLLCRRRTMPGIGMNMAPRGTVIGWCGSRIHASQGPACSAATTARGCLTWVRRWMRRDRCQSQYRTGLEEVNFQKTPYSPIPSLAGCQMQVTLLPQRPACCRGWPMACHAKGWKLNTF